MAAINLVKTDVGKYIIIVRKDAEFSDFKNYSKRLELLLGNDFQEKVDDFDTHYWVFSFSDSKFILYYNIYDGIKIYLQEEKDSKDTEKILSLFELLKNE